MMHFPELWEGDSLLFDDTAERELLLRQFQELIGEISSDEGYDISSEAYPFFNLRNEKGEVESRRNVLQLPSLFSSPTSHQQNSRRDWQVDSKETFNRELLAEEYQGNYVQVNGHQRTRRYDVPVDSSGVLSPLAHLSQAPPRTQDLSKQSAFGMLSLSHIPKSGVVGIVKIPNGNYYMAMPDSSNRGPCDADCNEGMMPSMVSTAAISVTTSRSDPSITPSLDSLPDSYAKASCGKRGRLTPRRLFPSEKDSRKTNRTPTSWKRAKTDPYQPNPSRSSPHLKNEIPQDIMNDLEVIRIHRRSSYADGDSLVEVQPNSLPGSPTMFAYRDPEGRLRVPLDMHCNQKALATYKRMMAPKAAATKIVSVCDMGQRQPKPTAHGIFLEGTFSGDSGNETNGSTVRTEFLHPRTPEMPEATVHNGKDDSAVQNIIEGWEKLRQQI